MRVSFHATLREVAGVSETELSADSLRELLDVLKSRFGDRLHGMIVQGGSLRDDVVILVNGQNIAHEKGLDTELDEQDDVAIFPPVSGG
ncbi:MAG: MoaD/ThiS family protein [Thermoplasmata archaeon]|nr:MoaD/ThiS family protein [Thermoplasmata archaeon]